MNLKTFIRIPNFSGKFLSLSLEFKLKKKKKKKSVALYTIYLGIWQLFFFFFNFIDKERNFSKKFEIFFFL